MSVGSKDGLQCENQSCGELSKKLCVYKSTSYILMLMENRRELEHPWNVSAFQFLAFRILYPGPVHSSQLDRAFPLLPHEQKECLSDLCELTQIIPHHGMLFWLGL